MIRVRMLMAGCLGLTLMAYSPRADLDAGHYLKALTDAEVELKANPSNALAWAAKSQSLTAMQRFWEAMPAAEKALSLNPNLADALQARGLARVGVAVQQRNLNSLRQASGGISDLEAAVEQDPSLTTAWFSLGLAYQELPGILGGSTRKALKCAESLHKVHPAKGDLLEGTILTMDARWPEAEPYFARALAAAPSDPDVVQGYLEALGSQETRDALGNTEQIRRRIVEARRLLPYVRASARGVEAVSLTLTDVGLLIEAWDVAKKGLNQVDAPSLLRLQLGKIAARTGFNREEGLALLDQVLREPLEGGSGGYPAAHWRRGQILRDLGRKAEAKAEAEEALKLDSNHPGAKKLLEELQ
jgi:tetratricopeptide (TPR) repeat protein